MKGSVVPRRLAARASALCLVLLLVSSLAPTVTAGSADAPEIMDATGDADPGSSSGLAPGTLHELGGNLSAYDIRQAFVTFESRDAFVLVLHVVDLDGGLNDAPTPPVPVPPPPVPVPPLGAPAYFANYTMHFTVADVAYLARAELRTNGTAIWSNWTLAPEDDADTTTDVFGWVLPTRNEIGWILPKSAVGAPEPGTTLTHFYATSGHDKVRLDYAPDPNGIDPTAIDPLGGDLDVADPGYGFEYTFGQYPGGPVQLLGISTSGPTTLQLAPGAKQELGFVVSNDGPQDKVVQLAVRAPRGWTTDMATVEVEVPSGGTKDASVTVSPAGDARDGTMTVTARSVDGSRADLRYSLEMVAPDQTTSPNAGSGSPYAADGPGRTGSEKDAPAPGIAPVLAVLAAIGVALQRRRSG